MNIYLKDKNSIIGLFEEVTKNLILSDEEAPANKFLLGDYTKVFTSDTDQFKEGQKKIFIARAESKYNEEDKDKHKQQINSYVIECIRLASPVEGVDTIGVFDLNDYDQTDQKDYTFYLGNTEENLTWKLDNNSEDNYTILTKWLKDNVFKEESYSSYIPKGEENANNKKKTKFHSFLSNAFNQNNKITDVIIYDPYILEIFHKKNNPDADSFNSTLFNLLKNLNELNIIIFTSNIIKFGHARKKIYDELYSDNHMVTFIEIPENAHDRFILSNYFYIKSGKGFMLDLEKSLGNDVTASKTGINTRKTFLEWSEKRNMLQNYLNNTGTAIISQGEFMSNLLDFTKIGFAKITEQNSTYTDEKIRQNVALVNVQGEKPYKKCNGNIAIVQYLDLTKEKVFQSVIQNCEDLKDSRINEEITRLKDKSIVNKINNILIPEIDDPDRNNSINKIIEILNEMKNKKTEDDSQGCTRNTGENNTTFALQNNSDTSQLFGTNNIQRYRVVGKIDLSKIPKR